MAEVLCVNQEVAILRAAEAAAEEAARGREVIHAPKRRDIAKILMAA